MKETFRCQCGVQFERKDLSGEPRTQCPICRAAIPVGVQAAIPTTAPPEVHSAPQREVSKTHVNVAKSQAAKPPVAKPLAPAATSQTSAPRRVLSVQQVAMFVGAVFFIAMGLVFGVFGALHHRQATQSKSWPSVSGTIVSSAVRQHENVGRRTRHIESYLVDVEYSYRVDGVQYYGDQISLGDLPMKRAEADSAERRYSTGSTHAVYYDPEDPSTAVLVREYGGTMGRYNATMGVALPAGCLLLGLVFLAGAYLTPGMERRWQEKQRIAAGR